MMRQPPKTTLNWDRIAASIAGLYAVFLTAYVIGLYRFDLLTGGLIIVASLSVALAVVMWGLENKE